ncbi:MAG: 1-acyl-sn-glycerol-3-phosphate acyltransferase [Firmicutes bacterium]|nr:1-acyl-sn-glycerol-3-phosphate acyltransferase [Bacillota bacterium]
MDRTYRRHQRIWKFLQVICGLLIRSKFDLKHDDIQMDGPVILISNHVTSWDPLLVAMSLKKKQVYYVASEHLFRKGFLTKVLTWLVAPIPRSKGNSGADTVKACLRHLKAGHSVCLFAEGEQSWDGRNNPIFATTGKLVRSGGATLITYRLEGAYLCLPRWAGNIRKGTIYGHKVGVYGPDELKAMRADEITEIISRDIKENAWERQLAEPREYTGKDLAVGLERMLYLCPECRKTGTLSTEGDRLSCTCGLKLKFRADGFFEPSSPFRDIAEWEDWQSETLRSGDFVHADEFFSDENVELKRIGQGHSETWLLKGRLAQYEDRITCGERGFALKDIDSMAMTRTHILLFSSKGEYYELSSEKGVNLRKYLEIWKAQSTE